MDQRLFISVYFVSVSQLAFCSHFLEVLPVKLADEKLFGEVTANCNRVVHSLRHKPHSSINYKSSYVIAHFLLEQ